MSEQTVLQVGADKQYHTINAAIAAADQMGGNADIKVDAGTYTNDGGYLWDGINNVTIEGVGGMVKIVDPVYYAGGKAAIVTGGQNILVKNLDISGITVPDGNGAGIRYDQGTLVLDNVHLHDNQNGILGGADATGSITIQNSEIDHNGTSAGNTHNIYIGDIAQFKLTTSYIHDANVGHEVKSRAENTTITNNRILDNTGTSSYAIDLPNGGNAVITGNVIEQGVNNQNHTINAYGEEGNLHAGTSVTFANNVVVNDDAEGRGPLWNNNGATITASGNTVWDVSDLGTGVNASGFTQAASRPGSAPVTTATGTTALHPTIGIITGVAGGGVRLVGSSAANSMVTVSDTVGGATTVLGMAVTSSNGAWSLTSHARVDTAAINSYTVWAQDQSGNTGSMAGQFLLASTGADTLTGTARASDVFAIMSFRGSDMIRGFETSASAGATHDYIDFSGRGVTSFNQVQSMLSGGPSAVINIGSGKTITLSDVAATSLTAADFRFS